MEPAVRIGKKGLTNAQIMEIAKHLDKRRTVKVKVLKTALTSDAVENIAQKASSATGARVIQIVGHTFTLSKPKNEEVSIYKTKF
jgi:putative YhbY family RNA-binding protein